MNNQQPSKNVIFRLECGHTQRSIGKYQWDDVKNMAAPDRNHKYQCNFCNCDMKIVKVTQT